VRFSPAEVERLREYVSRGGFLWGDDNYGMDRSFRREMAKGIPQNPLVDVAIQPPPSIVPLRDSGGVPKVHEHDGKSPQALGSSRTAGW